MLKLSDYIGNELFISQKSIWKREFELRSGDELIALMYYPKFFGDRTELSIQNEVFEFFRPKFFSRKVAVRKKGYENPFAHFKNNFWGSKGILELPRGNNLNIKFGIFKKQTEIFLGENDLLVTILSQFSVKRRSEVVIAKRSELIDEYPWIVMLGFYLSQVRKRSSAVGS
jgi:hypothetical protein